MDAPGDGFRHTHDPFAAHARAKRHEAITGTYVNCPGCSVCSMRHKLAALDDPSKDRAAIKPLNFLREVDKLLDHMGKVS